MPNSSGLRRKIWVAFILQMTAISFAAVLGVYAAATVTEDVLIKRVLQHDASYYLDKLEAAPDTPPPDTYFVQSYLERAGSDASLVPPPFRGLGPGFHRGVAAAGEIVYVTDTPHGRYYVGLDTGRTHHLVLGFGLALCAVIIVIVYFTTWMTY